MRDVKKWGKMWSKGKIHWWPDLNSVLMGYTWFKQAITGKALKIKDDLYEENCITCSVCSRDLKAVAVYSKDHTLYCEKHYKDKFVPKCTKCNEFITEVSRVNTTAVVVLCITPFLWFILSHLILISRDFRWVFDRWPKSSFSHWLFSKVLENPGIGIMSSCLIQLNTFWIMDASYF